MIYDLDASLYRWRQVMPIALGEAELGPENPEQQAARRFLQHGRVKIESKQEASGGATLYTGVVDRNPVEVLIDADGRIKNGKCQCSHHFKFGVRAGPCRHLQALRNRILQGPNSAESSNTAKWFNRLQRWANN